jgi:hypothetical protein
MTYVGCKHPTAEELGRTRHQNNIVGCKHPTAQELGRTHRQNNIRRM